MQACPHCGNALEYSPTPPRFCSHCGGSLHSLAHDATQPYSPPTTAPRLLCSDPLPPPECVGGYRLLRPLGAGGMGTVYEGEEIATGRRVAIKLIRPDFADSEDAIERFRREGRLASTVAHPRCVFVLAADEEAGRPYIVMELMPGQTLADLVAKQGPLSQEDAVARILDVIEGLQEAHRCGLIHRDVKPSNCFVDGENRVKVGDFGLSKSLVQDSKLTQTGAFLGTLLYASPEQIRHEAVDHQADIYSVAATLYFLLTGRAPFQGEDAAATLARTLTDPLTPSRKLRSEVPTTLDAVVSRGLAHSRDKRWRNLEEFRAALLPFVPGRHSPADVGWRVCAYLLDMVFAGIAIFVLMLLVDTSFLAVAPDLQQHHMFQSIVAVLTYILVIFVYFSIPESLWGGSLGKLLFRLRLRTVPQNDRLSLGRALWRSSLFMFFADGFSWVLDLGILAPLQFNSDNPPTTVLGWFLLTFMPPVASIAGWLLIASTMRRRNGYRALHDVLSGTMVVQLQKTPEALIDHLC